MYLICNCIVIQILYEKEFFKTVSSSVTISLVETWKGWLSKKPNSKTLSVIFNIVCLQENLLHKYTRTRTQTHTPTTLYIYIYIYVCVCICLSVSWCGYDRKYWNQTNPFWMSYHITWKWHWCFPWGKSNLHFSQMLYIFTAHWPSG